MLNLPKKKQKSYWISGIKFPVHLSNSEQNRRNGFHGITFAGGLRARNLHGVAKTINRKLAQRPISLYGITWKSFYVIFRENKHAGEGLIIIGLFTKGSQLTNHIWSWMRWVIALLAGNSLKMLTSRSDVGICQGICENSPQWGVRLTFKCDVGHKANWELWIMFCYYLHTRLEGNDYFLVGSDQLSLLAKICSFFRPLGIMVIKKCSKAWCFSSNFGTPLLLERLNLGWRISILN